MKAGSRAPDGSSAPGAPTANAGAAALPLAGAGRRFGALVYEALLLVAMAFVVGFAFLPLVSPSAAGDATLRVPPLYARTMLFCALVAGGALYCGWCWSEGRRTLPQKTWGLRLVDRHGRVVTWKRAIVRYAAWWIGPAWAVAAYAVLQPSGHPHRALVFLALDYAWAIVDPDRQFLHDRIAGTRLVVQRAS